MIWDSLHRSSICRADSCGNTFALIDGRGSTYIFSPEEIKALCSKSQGLDVDGLIIFEQKRALHTYAMRYFNCDGNAADLCGNGLASLSRWIYALHADKGLPHPTSFIIESIKASHHVQIELGALKEDLSVTCEMPPITDIEKVVLGSCPLFVANCGVPHLVIRSFSPQSLKADLKKYAALYRYHPHFARRGGVNINITCLIKDELHVRTFERGVEGETKSCGTGACVTAFWAHQALHIPFPIQVHMPGGILRVEKSGDGDFFSGKLKLTTSPKLFSVSPPLC